MTAIIDGNWVYAEVLILQGVVIVVVVVVVVVAYAAAAESGCCRLSSML